MNETEKDRHWREATSGVTPLSREEKVQSPTAPPSRLPGQMRPPRLVPADASAPGGIERGLLTRIRKGREPVEARLDLHGMTQEEAFEALCRFMASAYARQLRTVLVITGKGRGGEGTLRRAFVPWLETETLRGYVSGYHAAAVSHGGDGAWYVRLRRDAVGRL